MSDSAHSPENAHRPGQGGHEEEHEEHVNHEAWVIPYADMLTLLMALFLMLWATSSVDQKKFAALAESLRDAFGNGTGELTQNVAFGGQGVLDGQTTGVESGDLQDPTGSMPDAKDAVRNYKAQSTSAEKALEREKVKAEEKRREEAAMAGIQKRITEAAEKEGYADALEFKKESRGLVVTIVSDNVLFDSGSSVLRSEGAQILKVVGDALKHTPYDAMIEGHTDSTPITTSQYPSNWELSSARGTSVLRYLVDSAGFPGNKIASAGYGEMRPKADNSTADGRSANRRVEIVVLGAND